MVSEGKLRTYNIVVCVGRRLGVCRSESEVEIDEDAPFPLRRAVPPKEDILGSDISMEHANVIRDQFAVAWRERQLGKETWK